MLGYWDIWLFHYWNIMLLRYCTTRLSCYCTIVLLGYCTIGLCGAVWCYGAMVREGVGGAMRMHGGDRDGGGNSRCYSGYRGYERIR